MSRPKFGDLKVWDDTSSYLGHRHERVDVTSAKLKQRSALLNEDNTTKLPGNSHPGRVLLCGALFS
jgi:hypothetical protein